MIVEIDKRRIHENGISAGRAAVGVADQRSLDLNDRSWSSNRISSGEHKAIGAETDLPSVQIDLGVSANGRHDVVDRHRTTFGLLLPSHGKEGSHDARTTLGGGANLQRCGLGRRIALFFEQYGAGHDHGKRIVELSESRGIDTMNPRDHSKARTTSVPATPNRCAGK
ncbi:MAG: hypothetical protein E6H53_19655 [Betaproteobacteria bacterium]|nr:MAG: hypothetical protein E6H53_19655 [Betaproteobacteria bacterium]